jgi:hypothetical protein
MILIRLSRLRIFKDAPLKEGIPEQNHEFLRRFSQVLVYVIAPHRRGIDDDVLIKDGVTTSWGKLDSLSKTEPVHWNESLPENLYKELS